ncbi:uncharacterized protein LOC119339281 [Triticum dicoccoides]|uniref:uncharacterized protein LOC119339281 n=1 Tax=Triticum dicoccoides TaxID=85692 RepID=UPI001890D3CE|nr:uncharacterized protein LOC119339281 [Triticum dicoccoides]
MGGGGPVRRRRLHAAASARCGGDGGWRRRRWRDCRREYSGKGDERRRHLLAAAAGGEGGDAGVGGITTSVGVTVATLTTSGAAGNGHAGASLPASSFQVAGFLVSAVKLLSAGPLQLFSAGQTIWFDDPLRLPYNMGYFKLKVLLLLILAPMMAYCTQSHCPSSMYDALV